jgi:hypothetical protein
MQVETCLSIHPTPHLYFLREVCTIALPFLWEKRGTISTLVFPVSYQKCLGMNTSPQILAGVGKGFHYHALRRVMPEPWQLN